MATIDHGYLILFEQFRHVNEPDIIKKIIFYLDYESYRRCQKVNKSWRALLTSESFITKGKSVFQEKLTEIENQLHENVREGDLDGVKRLISCRMVNVNCVRGRRHATTPLYYAVREGQVEIAGALLDRGAELNSPIDNQTPLYIATVRGHADVVRLLLDRGANPDEADRYGMTPLHAVVAIHKRWCHQAIVKLLIQARADPSPERDNGQTPLHMATNRGATGLFMELLNGGAAADKPDHSGCTPLHLASGRGDKYMVLALLKQGANPDGFDRDMYRPLHHAAGQGYKLVVKLLLEWGADPNKTNIIGETPLHFAVREGHKNVVRTLVKSFANTTATDNDDNSPFNLANNGNGIVDLEMVNILMGAGPREESDDESG